MTLAIRRAAWHGTRPATADDARRRLIEAARASVERFGEGRASLSDVARAAGVTRQTVYRYFSDADDLFRSAAALSTGGFLERLRADVARCDGLTAQVVECLVFAITELPRDRHLGPLLASNAVDFAFLLRLRFVQDEIERLSGGAHGLAPPDLDELAELLLRLLRSFLFAPEPERTQAELRRVLTRWVEPQLRRPVAQ